ncbi:hypothetical protein QW131_25090 [Roseibium salinum]|nr:hypothetical protein [Roseibium salinum]
MAYQLESSMERQEAELLKLSRSRLLETLDADVKLAGARLEFLVQDRALRVSAIAERLDTANAIDSRNVVAMSELLGSAAELADVDSIVVLDDTGRVIGASSYEADLVTLGASIPETGFYDEIAGSLRESIPGRKQTYSAILPRSETGIFVPGEAVNTVSQVIFVPVFDDFGYVTGGLLAQRWLREQEPMLRDLTGINSFELALLHDDRVISRANFDGRMADLEKLVLHAQHHRQRRKADQVQRARCAAGGLRHAADRSPDGDPERTDQDRYGRGSETAPSAVSFSASWRLPHSQLWPSFSPARSRFH